MRAPVKRLLKRELVWLGTNFCKHSHTYLEHYNCFLRDYPTGVPGIIEAPEKIGCLDIETSSFQADFGYVICYCIKEYDKDKIYEYVLTQDEILKGVRDRDLMKQLCKDIKKFDRILVYWGTNRRHDLPFLRSRAVKYDLDFPKYRDMWATDIYTIVRGKLRLHKYRLVDACRFFGIPAKKHPLIPEIWLDAGIGRPYALNYILEHCREDVISLDLVTHKLLQFVRRGKTSI